MVGLREVYAISSADGRRVEVWGARDPKRHQSQRERIGVSAPTSALEEGTHPLIPKPLIPKLGLNLGLGLVPTA